MSIRIYTCKHVPCGCEFTSRQARRRHHEMAHGQSTSDQHRRAISENHAYTFPFPPAPFSPAWSTTESLDSTSSNNTSTSSRKRVRWNSVLENVEPDRLLSYSCVSPCGGENNGEMVVLPLKSSRRAQKLDCSEDTSRQPLTAFGISTDGQRTPLPSYHSVYGTPTSSLYPSGGPSPQVKRARKPSAL